MKKNIKNRISLLLTLAVAVSLCACGEKTEEELPAEIVLEDGMVYRASLPELPPELRGCSFCEIQGNVLFLAGSDINNGPCLYLQNLMDGTLREYKTDNEDENFLGFGGLAVSEEKIFVIYTANDGRGLYCEYIKAYDIDSGEILWTKQLKDLEHSDILSWTYAGAVLYGLYYDGSIVSVSEEGEQICKTEGEPSISSLIRSGGKLYALSLSEDYAEGELFEVSGEELILKKICDIGDTKFDLSENPHYMDVFSSSGEGGLYLINQQQLSSLNPKTGEVRPLFKWKDTGLEVGSGLRSFCAAKNGHMYMTDFYTKMLFEIAPAEPVTRKTLTVSCGEGLGTTYFYEAATRFNLSNPEYRVEIKMYPYENPALVLTELAAGEIPDVFYIGSSTDVESAFKYIRVSDNNFEDLGPWIDNDEKISREDFVPGVLESVEKDGHIYGIPISIGVSTITAPKKLADSLKEWNVDKLLELNEEMPEGIALFHSSSAEDLLSGLGGFINGEYVDYSAGSCNFENSDFGKWLELCKNLEPYDYNSSDGYTLMIGQGGHNIPDFFRRDHNDDYVYMGYPGAEGPRNFLIDQTGSFRIMKGSENKEAAWEFIKILLSPPLQNGNVRNFGYPSMLEAFIRDTENVYYEVDEKTAKTDAHRLKKAFSECSTVDQASMVDEIIHEEAVKYFADQQSLEDTVKIIQSRAGLYLAEQK